MQRKGLTAGSGRKGYYNVVGKDPQVHRQSAMGIKQPQRFIMLPERWSISGYKLRKGGKCAPSDLKHGSDPDSQFNPLQLGFGINVEMEHTNDKSLAKAIAKAHLKESPDYYIKLAKMEKSGKKSPKEVHVKSIEIRRAEGSRAADPLLGQWQKFDNVADADARLAQISSTAPASGGYDKTDVKVTFDNGDHYEGRWDVKHFSQPDNDTSIGKHIKDELNFYAGNTERGKEYIKNMGYPKSSTRKYNNALKKWKLE